MKDIEALKQVPDIDPGKWPDISRVFAGAATLEGASRQAYLDSACQHDPGLRAAVDSLLNAHNKSLATTMRDWQAARAWLFRRLTGNNAAPNAAP